MVKGSTHSGEGDKVAEIKRLYYHATRATIVRDLARAVEILKTMSEDDRERVAVYMDGLAQMRGEWEEHTGKAKVSRPKSQARRMGSARGPGSVKS